MIDWYEIKRILIHGRPNLRPWEVQRLTPAEIALYCDGDLDGKRPPSGGVDVSQPGAGDGYAAWWRSMTPRQRLEYYRNRR